MLALWWHGTVFLYDRQDGTLNWGAPIGDSAIGRPVFPVADERRVYATYRGHLACIEPRSDRLWNLEVDCGNGTIAIIDGALFVATTGGRCYAVA
ncbi:PQQ-binding-like beta-propeller repeat protein [Natronolimnobius baerhuensis]|uniref:hypothetical protein n=1 Tax=Natronolimnobius baerhuensis TaxID=253108 RepID=UPI0006D00DA0|nr:hypothetical protein [Natronolimnobius baerhuensis]